MKKTKYYLLNLALIILVYFSYIKLLSISLNLTPIDYIVYSVAYICFVVGYFFIQTKKKQSVFSLNSQSNPATFYYPPLSPLEFVKLAPPTNLDHKEYKHIAILTKNNEGKEKLNKALASKVFETQLGDLFILLNQLNTSEKKVFHSLSKYIVMDEKKIRKLIQTILNTNIQAISLFKPNEQVLSRDIQKSIYYLEHVDKKPFTFDYETLFDLKQNKYYQLLINKLKINTETQNKIYINKVNEFISTKALYLNYLIAENKKQNFSETILNSSEKQVIDYIKQLPQKRQNLLRAFNQTQKLIESDKFLTEQLNFILQKNINSTFYQSFCNLLNDNVLNLFIYNAYIAIYAPNQKYQIQYPEEIELMSKIQETFDVDYDTSKNEDALITEIQQHSLLQQDFQMLNALWIMQQHAYVYTGLMSLVECLNPSKIFFEQQFGWLKYENRDLWHCLYCALGQAAFVETAGVYSHWMFEKNIKRAAFDPQVQEAVQTLDVFVSSYTGEE